MASPKLRFKEFDGDWVLQNLGSLFSKRRDKGISGVPTYSVTLNNGIVNRDDLERDTPTNLSPQEHLLVKTNDLAYNMMRMWQGALGLAPTDGIVSPAYVVLKPSEQKTNSNFFEYYFKRNRQIHNFWAYSQGLTEDRLRLYFDDFKVIKINAPSKEEQTKIASFLSLVDEKIAQLSQKHKLLNQYKQGMMQKLFSQQIRFKADDGSEFEEWEKKPLVELSEKAMYGMNASAKEYDGRNKYLRITDICENSHKLKSDGFTSPNAQLEEKYKLKAGDLLFARTGASVGKSYLYTEDDGVTYFAGFLIKFSLKVDLVHPYFIFAQTLTSDFDKWVITNSMRSGQPGINAEEYSSYLFQVPCLEEQTKIANFLSAIDQKIEKVSQQIKETKQWKKGLLQQMFV